MPKAYDFKRAIASALGKTVGDIIIEDVVPLTQEKKIAVGTEAAEEAYAAAQKKVRRLSATMRGISVTYSVVDATANDAMAVQERLSATADFKGATIVGGPSAAEGSGAGGFSLSAPVVGAAVGAVALVGLVVGKLVSRHRASATGYGEHDATAQRNQRSDQAAALGAGNELTVSKLFPGAAGSRNAAVDVI